MSHPESFGSADSSDEALKRNFGGENWLDQRTRRSLYADREPQVLVIGAGQAGLSIAARLGALGIDTLIVDRNEEIGDNWRNRYHSLALHNEVYVNHLPYMPFPPTCSDLRTQGQARELVRDLCRQHGSQRVDEDIVGGRHLRRAAGSLDDRGRRPDRLTHPAPQPRRLRDRGQRASPIRPQLPGLQDFARRRSCTPEPTSTGQPGRAGTSLVLGTGNSGHDVAQDLHACGAHVTLIQRSPTTIVSLEEAQKLYAIYREGLPLEDADLLTISMPYPVMVRNYQQLTAEMRAADRRPARGTRTAVASGSTSERTTPASR